MTNMFAEFIPSIIVPLVGLIFPRIRIRTFFIYAETEVVTLCSNFVTHFFLLKYV